MQPWSLINENQSSKWLNDSVLLKQSMSCDDNFIALEDVQVVYVLTIACEDEPK